MKRRWRRGALGASLLAFLPPIVACGLIACSAEFRQYLYDAYSGTTIPSWCDHLRRFLAVAPILLSMFGIANGLTIFGSRSHKLITALGLFSSVLTFLASLLMMVH